MSLNSLQAEFTQCIAKLIVWCFENDYPVILAEAYRTPEQAILNAENGVGISNSLHTKKLAVDMFRVKDNTITWDALEYKPVGDQWKTMHELARHGGDFKSKDNVHFSFTYKGVQ